MSRTSSRPPPAVLRAEEFLRRVLPESDPEVDPDATLSESARVAGVDARTQERLEAMCQPDRESW